MLGPSQDAREFTLAEISGAISRVTGLAATVPEVAALSGNLLGIINSNRALLKAGIDSPALADYIQRNISPELAEKTGPVKRAEMLQQQEALARALAGNPAGAMNGHGLRAFANLPGGAGDRQGSVSGAASDSRSNAEAGPVFRGNIASVNSQNYSGTPFAASGMSYSTFDSLRAQGFGPTNIIHAAQDARTNGFDPNNKPIAKAFAVLDKDDGARRAERNHLLHDFREHLDKDEEFQRLKAERDKAATPEERAKIEQKLMERGKQISKDVGYHGHVEAAPTKRAKDAGKLIEHETIKQKIENKALEHTHGDRAEADKITSAMDDYRRNPTDAAARHRYDEAVPKSLQAQIRQGFQKDAALRRKTDVAVDKKEERNTEKTARNEEKTVRKEEIASANDEKNAGKNNLLAELNGDAKPVEKSATPEKKSAAKPAEKHDQKTAENKQEKPNQRIASVKTAKPSV